LSRQRTTDLCSICAHAELAGNRAVHELRMLFTYDSMKSG
jgi:hypothetical protein